MLSCGVCIPKCGEVAVGSGRLPLNPSSVTPAAPPLSAANSFPPACLFVFFLGKNQLKKKKARFLQLLPLPPPGRRRSQAGWCRGDARTPQSRWKEEPPKNKTRLHGKKQCLSPLAHIPHPWGGRAQHGDPSPRPPRVPAVPPAAPHRRVPRACGREQLSESWDLMAAWRAVSG